MIEVIGVQSRWGSSPKVREILVPRSDADFFIRAIDAARWRATEIAAECATDDFDASIAATRQRRLYNAVPYRLSKTRDDPAILYRYASEIYVGMMWGFALRAEGMIEAWPADEPDV